MPPTQSPAASTAAQLRPAVHCSPLRTGTNQMVRMRRAVAGTTRRMSATAQPPCLSVSVRLCGLRGGGVLIFFLCPIFLRPIWCHTLAQGWVGCAFCLMEWSRRDSHLCPREWEYLRVFVAYASTSQRRLLSIQAPNRRLRLPIADLSTW